MKMELESVTGNKIGRKRNFSEDEKKDFLIMYNNGFSLRAIAQKYNTSHSVIKNNIKSSIVQRPKSLIESEKIQQEIKELYLKGMSIGSLVSKYKDKKISPETIKKFLISENIHTTDIKSFKYASQLPKIYELLELGKSLSQISDILNISKSTLSNYVRLINDIPGDYYNKVRTYSFDMSFFENAYIHNSYELGFLLSNMIVLKRANVKCVDFYCEKSNKQEFIKIKENFTDKEIKNAISYKKEKYLLSCISVELYDFMNNFSIKKVKNKKDFFYGYIVASTHVSENRKTSYIKFKNKEIASYFSEYLKLENTDLYNCIFPLLKEYTNSVSFLLYPEKADLLFNFLKGIKLQTL